MAGRMLDRLKSDADTLITSDAEWATDKFFEISGYILGAASIALTGALQLGSEVFTSRVPPLWLM